MSVNCELHKRFCQNVRALRLEKGMTQQELADATGLHRPDISAIEAGRYAPTLSTVEIVAKGLGIKPEGLFLLDLVEA